MKKLIETIRNIWNIEDLRDRLLVTLGILAIYRFGSFVVIPGVDPAQLSALQDQTADGLLGLLRYPAAADGISSSTWCTCLTASSPTASSTARALLRDDSGARPCAREA